MTQANNASPFETVALEFNADSNIWNPDTILWTLGFMREVGMNALVLNSVRLLERLVYPGSYFGATDVNAGVHRRYQQAFRELYRLDPGRRSRPYQNIEYLRWIARRAEAHGVRLFLNNKELYFPDIIPELQPQLTKDGKLCPTDPFWPSFLRTKYEELFSDIPELAGTITSPATSESRLSIYGNRCTCDRCQSTDPVSWFESIMAAMHEPADRHGKTLVLRDFVFDRATQESLASAIEGLPPEIVVCLKYTPHDYYPTFPHNPRIGDVGDHPQWVEFDAMGQYFGWGIAPAAVLDDTRDRLEHARRNGATGMLVRVDWEGLEGHSTFSTPNRLILHALARLTNDAEATNTDIYEAWATDVDAVRNDAAPSLRQEGLEWLGGVFDRTWPVVARTLFSHGCVFSDSSQFPVSVEHAFWLAEEKNSLQDWDKAAVGALDPGPDNVRALMQEKDASRDDAEQLRRTVEAGHPALKPAFHGDLIRRFRVFQRYVEVYRLAAHAAFLGRHVEELGGDADAEFVRLLEERLQDLDAACGSLANDAAIDWFPASTLLSADRLRCLFDDATAILRRASSATSSTEDRA